MDLTCSPLKRRRKSFATGLFLQSQFITAQALESNCEISTAPEWLRLHTYSGNILKPYCPMQAWISPTRFTWKRTTFASHFRYGQTRSPAASIWLNCDCDYSWIPIACRLLFQWGKITSPSILFRSPQKKSSWIVGRLMVIASETLFNARVRPSARLLR